MRKTLVATVAITGLLGAQEHLPTEQQRMAARESAIHGQLGLTVSDQYFFRGIRQEASGVQVQPWVELGFDLLDSEGDETLRDLRLVVGQWNSLHSGRTNNRGMWYESRFYAGLESRIGDSVHFGARFNTYTSPNAAGIVNGLGTLTDSSIKELEFHAAIDDRGMFAEGFALNPHFVLAFELDGARDSLVSGGIFGTPVANDEGVYLELGLTPEFAIGKVGESDVTLGFPTRLGLSLDNYYEAPTGANDDVFGYFQVGAVASMPLNYLPARFGPWRGDVGLHLIFLGDNMELRNAGDSADVFVTVGMSTMF